jgi:hypothetical protein
VNAANTLTLVRSNLQATELPGFAAFSSPWHFSMRTGVSFCNAWGDDEVAHDPAWSEQRSVVVRPGTE